MNSTKSKPKPKNVWLFEEVINITGIAGVLLSPFNMMAYRFNHQCLTMTTE
jgi:hypothetical protein